MLLVLSLTAPWLIAGVVVVGLHDSRAVGNPPTSRVGRNEGKTPDAVLGKAGPWGQLLYTDILLYPPDEFVSIPPSPQRSPVEWFFKAYSKEKVVELFRSTDLAPAQLDALLNRATWATSPAGTTVTPGDELILGLSPAARAKIYTILTAHAENTKHIVPVCFRSDLIDRQLQSSGLSETSRRLFRGLLYQPNRFSSLLADLEPAMRALPDDIERRRFVKTMACRTSLLVELRVNADSDVEALANYWGAGGRRKDVIPLLNSLHSVEGGRSLNIDCLLPPFIRTHLYTCAFPSATGEPDRQDCFWSAFNAFKAFDEAPDYRFCKPEFVRQTLERDYYGIVEPSSLGDLVFVSTADNRVIHAAVYLADDVVFTKNGIHFSQPWILMHMRDMMETYAARYAADGPLKMVCYRAKSR